MRSRLQFLAAALFVLLLQSRLGAAEPLKMDLTVQLDSHGDGTMEVKTHLSALAWRQWEQIFGNHPDLILRNLKRQFASLDLDKDSYRLEKDEIKRDATSRLQCHALAVLQKDGSLAAVLPKPMHLVTHSGHEWIFSLNTPGTDTMPGSEQTSHILLPEGETDAHIQYADTADQQLVFRAPRPPMSRPIFLTLGIALGCLGIVLLAASWVVPKRKAPGATTLAGDGFNRARPTVPTVPAPAPPTITPDRN